jgi:hypothetical protein
VGKIIVIDKMKKRGIMTRYFQIAKNAYLRQDSVNGVMWSQTDWVSDAEVKAFKKEKKWKTLSEDDNSEYWEEI